MRIVITDFMSLDGVVQAPGGPEEDADNGFAHGGWTHPYFDVEVTGGFVDEAMASTEALLFGRRTFTVMAGAWPERAGDPFADRMNAIEKYVVSSTLGAADVTWTNSKLIAPADFLDTVRALRERDGGDVQVMGSVSVARTLLTEGLVDELKLMVHPILLGGGKSIFPADGGSRPLHLTGVVQTGTGVLICTYRTA